MTSWAVVALAAVFSDKGAMGVGLAWLVGIPAGSVGLFVVLEFLTQYAGFKMVSAVVLGLLLLLWAVVMGKDTYDECMMGHEDETEDK